MGRSRTSPYPWLRRCPVTHYSDIPAAPPRRGTNTAYKCHFGFPGFYLITTFCIPSGNIRVIVNAGNKYFVEHHAVGVIFVDLDDGQSFFTRLVSCSGVLESLITFTTKYRCVLAESFWLMGINSLWLYKDAFCFIILLQCFITEFWAQGWICARGAFRTLLSYPWARRHPCRGGPCLRWIKTDSQTTRTPPIPKLTPTTFSFYWLNRSLQEDSRIEKTEVQSSSALIIYSLLTPSNTCHWTARTARVEGRGGSDRLTVRKKSWNVGLDIWFDSSIRPLGSDVINFDLEREFP